MMRETTVGFVGLGDQGAPIARRIIDAGYPTTLWARRPAALAPFANTPARTAATLAELGRRCDVVGVCVYADADVDQVLRGEGGLLATMRPGSTVLIHSTAHPDLCRALAKAGQQQGVAVLDAPVSGGNARAAAGQLAVMVGGDHGAYDAALPVLRTFATHVEWLGPSGSGQACKLLNNAVTTINFAVSLASLDAGEQLGLDRAALARMLLAGSAQSFGLQVMAGADQAGLRHAEARLHKDVDLWLGLLRQHGAADGFAADAARRAMAAFTALAGRPTPEEPTP